MQLTINSPKIWLYHTAVDFRKGISGLSALMLELEGVNVHHDVLVFYNKNISKLKILAWHKNGFVMICKYLDKRKFTISKGDTIELSAQQLSWLLAGLDWITMGNFNELEYDHYF